MKNQSDDCANPTAHPRAHGETGRRHERWQRWRGSSPAHLGKTTRETEPPCRSRPQYPMNQRDPPSHPSPRAPLSVFGYPLPEWEHVEL